MTTIPQLYSYYISYPNICTDTRKITEGCLFFALKGENFNANQFAAQALERGASYVVIDDKDYQADERYLLVDDSLIALQQLAIHHRSQLKIPFIGLTGSNGKTTTKELINSVLSQKFKTLATEGNLNNHIGVPLTLLKISKEVEVAIIEMGANHQKEIEMLCEICQPNFGLVTNIGKAHMEGFGGMDGIKKGKGELYDYLQKNHGSVFINQDSAALNEMAGQRTFRKVFYYGTSSTASLKGTLTANDPFLRLTWTYQNRSHQVSSQLTGIYNFENILAAIAIGLEFGLSPDEINTGIANYAPKNNRSQIIKTSKNTVIGDYYNANPSSVALAIENIAKLNATKKVLILGDMFEIGETSAQEHLEMLQKANSYNFDQVILIGKAFNRLNKSDGATFFETTPLAYDYLSQNPIEGALILLKGSRGMKLESLLDLL